MLNFRFRKGSSSKTIVLLHGFMEDLSMWQDSFFPTETSLLAIDLPGHGSSELVGDFENPSMQIFAEAVVEVIDFTRCNNYDVVGHSMGGYVALELKQIDSRCENVVLYHSNFWEDSEEKKRDRIRVADLVIKNKDLFISEAMPSLFFKHERKSEVVQKYITAAKNISSSSIAFAALAMRNRLDFSITCKDWKSDLWFIHGESDPLIPLNLVMQHIQASPFKLKLLKEAGHMSHVEAPEMVTRTFAEIFAKYS